MRFSHSVPIVTVLDAPPLTLVDLLAPSLDVAAHTYGPDAERVSLGLTEVHLCGKLPEY